MGGLIAMVLGVTISAGDPGPTLAPVLAALSQKRVLFGHQSVGADVLEGVTRLLAVSPGGAVRVAELAAAPISKGTIAHTRVASNGNAEGKLESFEAALAAFPGGPPDVAAVKFCWADVGAETDVDALFARYRETLGRLARRYPATRFLHVTVPLTTVQDGPKALVKRLLGRAPYGALENARRETFNEQLRAAYPGALFDLAREEAALPGGGVATSEWQGRTTIQLAPASTRDGGHLTPEAQDRVARSFLAALARDP